MPLEAVSSHSSDFEGFSQYSMPSAWEGMETSKQNSYLPLYCLERLSLELLRPMSCEAPDLSCVKCSFKNK